jgi:hypothetical protein
MLQEGAAKLAVFSEAQANVGKDLGKVASIRALQ